MPVPVGEAGAGGLSPQPSEQQLPSQLPVWAAYEVCDHVAAWRGRRCVSCRVRLRILSHRSIWSSFVHFCRYNPRKHRSFFWTCLLFLFDRHALHWCSFCWQLCLSLTFGSTRTGSLGVGYSTDLFSSELIIINYIPVQGKREREKKDHSLRPCLVPRPTFFHPSHRIFGHMHGILNVYKKNKLITQFG